MANEYKAHVTSAVGMICTGFLFRCGWLLADWVVSRLF